MKHYLWAMTVVWICSTGWVQAKPATGFSHTTVKDAPASEPHISPDAATDPFEPFNRVMFDVNQALDIIFIEPLAQLYTTVLPSPVRTGLANVVHNAASPLTIVHEAVQLKGEEAFDSFFRFVVNTTVGLGGVFDVATKMNIPYHKGDMGQTLATYGVKSGPYLVLPLLGPSTIRDTAGHVTDTIINPLRLVLYHNDLENVYHAQSAVGALNTRAEALDLTERMNKMPDPYIQYRSLYLQNQAYRTENREIDTADLPGADADESAS